jgi:hypothetical protein
MPISEKGDHTSFGKGKTERQLSLQALRAAIQAGVESGPGIPADEVFARLEMKYSRS